MKKMSLLTTIMAALALCVAFAGCAPSQNTDDSQGMADTGAAAEGSLVAVHEAIGQDISGVTEVSIEQCSSCHAWEKAVEKTDALWEGIGQISDANPHFSHATNAFECSDCHSLTESQVNVCNQCHIFESPEGWVDKDKTTTNYGIKATEPQY